MRARLNHRPETSAISWAVKGTKATPSASKCTAVIRTTSFLSAWASIFNPDLKVVLLNKPYSNRLWYPEREILRLRDTEYWPESLP